MVIAKQMAVLAAGQPETNRSGRNIRTSRSKWIFLHAAILAVGCGTGSTEEMAGHSASRAPLEARACAGPLRLVAFQDKSGSGNENRTPQVETADLHPLVDYVTRCGGELGLGTIDIQSNAPLVRLYVEEFPAPPREPARRGTPFQIAQARQAYEAELARYQAAADEHRARLQRDTAAFLVQAAELLSQQNNAPQTDVWGAISRAGYFLGEHGRWERPPRLVAVMISDAIDNTGAPVVPLPERTELYLINGEPSLGALNDLKPIRFESFDAAVRYILNRE